MANEVTPITSARIMTLYPGVRPVVYRILQDINTMTRRQANIAQATRSMAEQLQAYSQGRQLINGVWQVSELKKVVTNAKPGMSFHCYGLAWDISWAGSDPYLDNETKQVREELWMTYGGIVKSNGAKWGGDFHLINGVKDLPHGEISYGLREMDCLELYQHGGTSAVWSYIDKLRGLPIGEGWMTTSGAPLGATLAPEGELLV